MNKFWLYLIIITTSIIADPTINGVSVPLIHTSSVNISGVGFTTKTTAVPVLWDAVDNISAYSGVTDGQSVPAGVGYPWGENGFALPDNIKMERTIANQRGVSTACYT